MADDITCERLLPPRPEGRSETKIIDAEFSVVIEPSEAGLGSSYVEPEVGGLWSFWRDDLPALGAIATSVLVAYLVRLFLL